MSDTDGTIFLTELGTFKHKVSSVLNNSAEFASKVSKAIYIVYF